MSLLFAGWFCKFGFLELNLPVSVFILRDPCTLPLLSIYYCRDIMNVFSKVEVFLIFIKDYRAFWSYFPNSY